MSNKIVKEWVNESGIKCQLREDGRVWEVLITGTTHNVCQADFYLELDKLYCEKARLYLQGKKLEKSYHEAV